MKRAKSKNQIENWCRNELYLESLMNKFVYLVMENNYKSYCILKTLTRIHSLFSSNDLLVIIIIIY